MDIVKDLFEFVIVTAPRRKLMNGDSGMKVGDFNRIAEHPSLAHDDKILGIAFGVSGKIENAYLVYERSGVPLKASFTQRPIYHSYKDKEYWKTNQTWFSTTSQHQAQHNFWINALNTPGLPVLEIGV